MTETFESRPAIIDLPENGILAGAPLVRLNNDHATELSYLEADEMRAMVREACVAVRIGEAAAFLLAFDETAHYSSPNYLWFRERFERFVYVDRVCVASDQRGRGLARELYRHVIAHACSTGAQRVVCEVNSEPPNPASDAFHASFGFREVGSSVLADRGKRVRYFELPIKELVR